MTLAAAAAALVALALYRLLSRTSGLNLGAGWATIGLAFGLAAAVALTGPVIARIALRRWRWLRADDDTSRAHAAWREFHDDLTDYGITCPASEPPRTLAARVTTGLSDPASQAIRRLALAEERARYAASPSGSGTLRRDGATARRALAATAGSSARWRARIFPPSLITALADATTRLPDHLATRLTRWPARHHPTRSRAGRLEVDDDGDGAVVERADLHVCREATGLDTQTRRPRLAHERVVGRLGRGGRHRVVEARAPAAP